MSRSEIAASQSKHTHVTELDLSLFKGYSSKFKDNITRFFKDVKIQGEFMVFPDFIDGRHPV